ncbi:TetR/AcrR family transcriptional regulator [Sphingosinicella rhizophila]|uniref:TetR family transcriptional regulator n=1 Tax=Sphingosinicella rhizophila TaxID=3050082 RepID=A0ABU3Q7G0_9SPHN|nr:TetR family transcriptional regulator [Sphingosinicella sp. GR2756]MDT9598885.1 TetR family transcriptional regulator [Sphingosinicella sp. GR2756]
MLCPIPRAKNAAATRQAMLTAARRRFLQESYENVGLRDIAGDAGVDVALVSRYFGSKEDLFKEVLREGKEDKFQAGLNARNLPAYLTAMALEQDGQGDIAHLERLLIVVRSASSPKAAELVRTAFRDDMLAPMAALLDGDDADIRASLALALLMGTTILRTVMSVQPICEAEGECSAGDRLVKLFEAALAEAGAAPK